MPVPSEEYSFPDLPLSPLPPGTSVMVEGPYHGGARDVAYRMLASADEGQVVVSTTNNAAQLLRDYRALGLGVERRRTAVVDCVGTPSEGIEARPFSVSSPRDLTGIAMRLSTAYQDLLRASIHRVRMGIVSVSALLTVGEVRSVFRFISTIAGRIANLGGLGVFVVDPAVQDTRTTETLAQFVQGRVQIREQDEKAEIRSLGIAGQPSGWHTLDTDGANVADRNL